MGQSVEKKSTLKERRSLGKEQGGNRRRKKLVNRDRIRKRE